MTDLSLKNKIIAISSYIFSVAILIYQNSYLFSVIYFACVGLVLFFADKIFDNERIKEKTLCAFFLASVSYQTLFPMFWAIHENNKHLMIAAAVAIFIAAVFAMTDKAKVSYLIVVAPVLCFLDQRTALCFSGLLLAWSVSKILAEEKKEAKSKNNKKSKKKQSNKALSSLENIKFLILTALMSLVCIAVCIYLSIQKDNIVIENYKYFIQQFKNTIGFVVVLIYLLIKAFRYHTKPALKISFIPGILLCIVPVTFFVKVYGWASVSLALICSIAYLGLICFENEQIIQSIKDDYSKNKYLFWVLLLLMLR